MNHIRGIKLLNLVEDLKVSIFEENIDIAIDYIELGLDNILDSVCDNEIIKRIPIVSTVYSVCKIGSAIHEKHLLRKTLIFISSFNSKKIKAKKLEKYRKKIETNSIYAQEELGRVLLLLNKILDDEKAKILANLFRNYIEEEIDWEQFCEMTDITERIFLSDIFTLKQGYINSGVDLGEVQTYHLDRLIALGLFENHTRLGGIVVIDGGNLDDKSEGKVSTVKDVDITELGILFCANAGLI